jgi:hypothetical protein
MKTSSCVVASLALVAACGGGDGKKKPIVDAPPPMVDGPPPCSAPASFTQALELELFYNADSQNMVTGNQELWRTIGTLESGVPTQDWIWIELFEGPPPDYTTENFPATPFTINLTGAETDYLKCSTCVTLTTDVNTTNTAELEYLDDYMATAGSVEITMLSPTMIAGTLTGINFAHVDISMAGTMPNASGCTSTLATLPFTAMVTPMANGSLGAKVGLPALNARRPLR